ncbi:MAG: nitrile hydratase accessory protein, partial [Rhodospirillaceae bacterium]|nr:nitrile hydratase accessory protein [Rhodospirillaceae bacterium]
MAETLPIDRFPELPRDDQGPVFSEPWQAEAFAMTVKLHADGH